MDIITDSKTLQDHHLISLCEEFFDRAKEEFLYGDRDVATDYLNMANVFANMGPYFHPVASFEELINDK